MPSGGGCPPKSVDIKASRDVESSVRPFKQGEQARLAVALWGNAPARRVERRAVVGDAQSEERQKPVPRFACRFACLTTAAE